MPQRYSDEFKHSAVHRYQQGIPIPSLCAELHIAPSTFYQWRKRYCSIRTPSRNYTPKDFDDLLRHVQKLENEISIIRLSGLLSNTPLRKKLENLETIHVIHPEFSVYELCEALGVPRGTFYNHIFRRADPTKREEARMQLTLKVQQIFDDSGQRYGARKIHAVLAESGIHVSPKTVNAVMRELGLQSIRTDAKKEYAKWSKAKKANYLNRTFTAEQSNQIWVSDITCFKVSGYWMYLCVIIDLYSRIIVGYRVSPNASTHLVTAAFRAAFKGRGSPEHLTFHSDRGTQYTSGAFCKLLRQCDVRQSFSAPGKPIDNAVSDSFFSAFKKEEAYRREYTSENSFRKSVDHYVKFYNEKRPHQTLKYKTPCQYELNCKPGDL